MPTLLCMPLCVNVCTSLCVCWTKRVLALGGSIFIINYLRLRDCVAFKYFKKIL
uniref:Uncharacterized protein n=1 Tax=Octopus bimaculoides TaxID=37653 RepID=A0A0L8GNE9_OCTBM